jgi:hypothetical protein
MKSKIVVDNWREGKELIVFCLCGIAMWVLVDGLTMDLCRGLSLGTMVGGWSGFENAALGYKNIFFLLIL